MKKARQIGSILLAVLMVLAATGCRPADKPATVQPDPTETHVQLQGTEATAASQISGTTEPGPTVSPSDPSEVPTDPSVPATAPTEPIPTEPPATAHTHSYTASVVAPSCSAQGYTVHSCACGASYRGDYTSTTAHSWGEWFVNYEATFAREGEQLRRCSQCGTYETQTIEKIPLEVAKAEIAMAVIKYINQFRAEEGSTQLTYLPGMSQVAQYRSMQLVTNFAHDTADLREALAYYSYGKWINPAEYGDPDGIGYYTYNGGEAISQGGWTGTADEIGYKIAKGLQGSTGHWRYVGSSDYSYVGIGVTRGYSTMFEQDVWFVCTLVGEIDYG